MSDRERGEAPEGFDLSSLTGSWPPFGRGVVEVGCTTADGVEHRDEVVFLPMGSFTFMKTNGAGISTVRMDPTSMRRLALVLAEGADVIEARS